MSRPTLADWMTFFGILSIVTGVSMVSIPVGVTIGGVMVLIWGVVLAIGEIRR